MRVTVVGDTRLGGARPPLRGCRAPDYTRKEHGKGVGKPTRAFFMKNKALTVYEHIAAYERMWNRHQGVGKNLQKCSKKLPIVNLQDYLQEFRFDPHPRDRKRTRVPSSD